MGTKALTTEKIKKAALEHAKNQLGETRFNNNKLAVIAISGDFIAGVKWSIEFLNPQQQQKIQRMIRSVKLCLMAHPDNEPDSEFEDRISDLEEIEDILSLTQTNNQATTT